MLSMSKWQCAVLRNSNTKTLTGVGGGGRRGAGNGRRGTGDGNGDGGRGTGDGDGRRGTGDGERETGDGERGQEGRGDYIHGILLVYPERNLTENNFVQSASVYSSGIPRFPTLN